MKSKLRPKARLLRTLGADLISSEKVALVELVKNSYDADASRVDITFNGPLKEGQGVIEILDDGHGMDSNTIENTWLTIATNSKRSSSQKTPKGRPILGEKGIGRLAISRLGTVLEIISKTKNSNNEVFLTINWDDFNNDELYLDELSVNWIERKPEIFKNSSPKNSGTLLKIKSISKDYTEDDIKDIYNSLTRLIPPIKNDIQEINNDDIFSIYLNFKDVEDTYNKYSGSIESDFDTHDPHYRLVGAIDDKGKLEGKFIYLDRATKKFYTTDISEIIWNKNHNPTCGDIYFDFKVWDRDNDSLKLLFKSDEFKIKPQDFRTSLDERAGISIYRDGFRVFPYGESGNDWLDLDKRRIQNPSQRISNNQILGSVFIGSQTNPLLKDQSNREGILDGAAYSDFKTLLSNAISTIEKKRGQKKDKKINSTKLPRLFENMDISNIISWVEENYPNDNKLEKVLSKKQKEINANITQVRNVLSSYSRLATLGNLVDRLVHEIRSPLSSIKHNSTFIENDIKDKNLEQDIRKSILSRAEKIIHSSDMISASIKRIDPFSARKIGRPKKVDINDLIINVIDMFSKDINKKNINIHYDALECYATIDPGEFSLVLRNLLENAIYWSSHPESHNPKNPDIKITVSLINKTSIVLRVSDTGPGVKEEDKYRIFHPYVSNKFSGETGKEGTGLGLTIAGHLVEDIYKGELNLIQYGALEGATFEAIFNKRSS